MRIAASSNTFLGSASTTLMSRALPLSSSRNCNSTSPLTLFLRAAAGNEWLIRRIFRIFGSAPDLSGSCCSAGADPENDISSTLHVMRIIHRIGRPLATSGTNDPILVESGVIGGG